MAADYALRDPRTASPPQKLLPTAMQPSFRVTNVGLDPMLDAPGRNLFLSTVAKFLGNH